VLDLTREKENETSAALEIAKARLSNEEQLKEILRRQKESEIDDELRALLGRLLKIITALKFGPDLGMRNVSHFSDLIQFNTISTSHNFK